jgi:hypothetical protein
MLNFNEDLLQFIWQYKLLKPLPLLSISGKAINVLKFGDLNKDAGPDFFNAQIKIETITLVGNIELHLKTSDWLKHKHQNNTVYDNIILHVVYQHDVEIPQNTNNNVEVIELKNLIDEKTISNYAQLIDSKTSLPCANQLQFVNEFVLSSWLQRMAIERLEVKTHRIENLFQQFNGDYSQTFYTLLLSNFGFKVNSLPFELLAKQLTLSILLKHADNLMALEALLFGCSGFLEGQFEDKYINQLQNEFDYLKTKYTLIPLNKSIFKYNKMRPANFPTLRLAQFALLIHQSKEFLLHPQNFTSYNQVLAQLKLEPHQYFKNHYKPDGNEVANDIVFGDSAKENIIINSIAPFFFFYSKKMVQPNYVDLALDLLAECGFEKNQKSKLFLAKKSQLKNAMDSQGLINLYDNYCTKKQCLKCGIGSGILKSR